MKLAIILLNYKAVEDTIREVSRVKELVLDGIETKIVIIDNASNDGSYEKLSALYNGSNDIVLFKADDNGGYAKGNNIGLKYAYEKGYDYSLVLNSDIVFPDKYIVKKLIDIMTSSEDLGAVSPVLEAPDGYRYNPEIVRQNFYDMTFGMLAYRKKGRKIADNKFDENREFVLCYRPQGSCMLLDNKKLFEIDYLDENTFLYYEESILAERLLRKDYKCALALNCKAIHEHNGTNAVEKNAISRKVGIAERLHNRKQYEKIYAKSYRYYLREYRKFGLCKLCVCTIFLKVKLQLLKR